MQKARRRTLNRGLGLGWNRENAGRTRRRRRIRQTCIGDVDDKEKEQQEKSTKEEGKDPAVNVKRRRAPEKLQQRRPIQEDASLNWAMAGRR